MKTDAVGDLRNVYVGLSEQFACFSKTDVAYEIARGKAQQFFHLPVEVGAAQSHFLTEPLDVKPRIVEVFVDDLNDFVDKNLVVAFQFGSIYFAVLLLSTGKFTAQAEAVVDEAVDN